MKRIWMAAAAIGLLATTAYAQSEDSLEVSAAWIRALPSGQPHTAAYLHLANGGQEAIGVVGARCDIAETVEIHTTRQIDGFMRMEQLSGVALAPGEAVAFAPGGTHLMLMGLKYMPAPGDEIDLCLELASGEEVCTLAQVHKSDPATSGSASGKPGTSAPDHTHHH